jgi:hypothetical protein
VLPAPPTTRCEASIPVNQFFRPKKIEVPFSATGNCWAREIDQEANRMAQQLQINSSPYHDVCDTVWKDNNGESRQSS